MSFQPLYFVDAIPPYFLHMMILNTTLWVSWCTSLIQTLRLWGGDLGDKVLPSPNVVMGYVLRDVETAIATVEEPSNELDIAGNKLSLCDQCTPTTA